MEAIAEKHKALISALTKLYDLLILMRHISPSDVVRPPHDPTTIQAAVFTQLGYESEVIDLMRLLPALRTEVVWGYQSQGTEILPRSNAVNYFLSGNDLEWLPLLRWGDDYFSEDTKLLPPWMLRLTLGQMYPGQYGADLIYDTRNKHIIKWIRIGGTTWDNSPSRPAETVLSNIISKLESLEWVPYDDRTGDAPPTREILQNPIIFQNIWSGGIRLPESMTTAIEQLRRQTDDPNIAPLRHSINKWWALQKMYRDCGWGTADFDGDELERRRNQ